MAHNSHICTVRRQKLCVAHSTSLFGCRNRTIYIYIYILYQVPGIYYCVNISANAVLLLVVLLTLLVLLLLLLSCFASCLHPNNDGELSRAKHSETDYEYYRA